MKPVACLGNAMLAVVGSIMPSGNIARKGDRSGQNRSRSETQAWFLPGTEFLRSTAHNRAGRSNAFPTMLSSSTMPKGLGRKFSPAFSSRELLRLVGE